MNAYSYQRKISLLLIAAALTACGPETATSVHISPVLLFKGTGISPNDLAAIENILTNSHLGYSTVDSSQLNAMSESQLSRHRLLIIPGGNFVAIGDSLSPNTTSNVRNAVKAGMNYLGIRAGAFLAGSFPAPYKSFDLTSGVKFNFYSAGKSKAALRITPAHGPALDQYWEDGPQFTGWGEVIGKYPDGTPAIVQGPFGQGWVLLAGVHPEAPLSWRQGMKFNTPVSQDTAYAQSLILAALNHTELPHY